MMSLWSDRQRCRRREALRGQVVRSGFDRAAFRARKLSQRCGVRTMTISGIEPGLHHELARKPRGVLQPARPAGNERAAPIAPPSCGEVVPRAGFLAPADVHASLPTSVPGASGGSPPITMVRPLDAIQRSNSAYVEEMYARFQRDPGAVPADWAAFFAAQSAGTAPGSR